MEIEKKYRVDRSKHQFASSVFSLKLNSEVIQKLNRRDFSSISINFSSEQQGIFCIDGLVCKIESSNRSSDIFESFRVSSDESKTQPTLELVGPIQRRFISAGSDSSRDILRQKSLEAEEMRGKRKAIAIDALTINALNSIPSQNKAEVTTKTKRVTGVKSSRASGVNQAAEAVISRVALNFVIEWLVIRNLTLGVGGRDLWTFFAGVDLKAVFACPAIGSHQIFEYDNIDAYLEFQSIDGAELAFLRNGELLNGFPVGIEIVNSVEASWAKAIGVRWSGTRSKCANRRQHHFLTPLGELIRMSPVALAETWTSCSEILPLPSKIYFPSSIEGDSAAISQERKLSRKLAADSRFCMLPQAAAARPDLPSAASPYPSLGSSTGRLALSAQGEHGAVHRFHAHRESIITVSRVIDSFQASLIRHVVSNVWALASCDEMIELAEQELLLTADDGLDSADSGSSNASNSSEHNYNFDDDILDLVGRLKSMFDHLLAASAAIV